MMNMAPHPKEEIIVVLIPIISVIHSISFEHFFKKLHPVQRKSFILSKIFVHRSFIRNKYEHFSSEFLKTILPNSDKKPYLMFGSTNFCFHCRRALMIFRSIENQLNEAGKEKNMNDNDDDDEVCFCCN